MRSLPDSEVSQASSSSESRHTITSSSSDSHSYYNNASHGSVRIAATELSGACITCFGSCRLRPKESPSSSRLQTTGSNNFPVQGSNSCTTTTTSSSNGSGHKYKEASNFSMKEILKATGNFASDNIIGRGRFGTVYRGKLKDGTILAVKRASENLSNNAMSSAIKNEIQTLSKVQHMNLLRCFGYLEQDGETIIILEYAGNGNLREHLDGCRGGELEIAARIEIAIDVVHAVTYLHSYADHPIIHRNIKASNILITKNFRAKVSDFGLAYLVPDNLDATHISTMVRGSPGYMDPEYLETNQLTEKSDVYSFGVLLIEMVTGRRPVETQRQPMERITTKWAMRRYKAGDGVMVMDPRLRRSRASVVAVEGLLGLACKCLASPRQTRPSMQQCGKVLWRIRKHYRETSVVRDAREQAGTASSPPPPPP